MNTSIRYDFKVFNKNASFFSEVAIYLLNHKELLCDPEYLRLYNSCLDFLIEHNNKSTTLTAQEVKTLKSAFEIAARITYSDSDLTIVSREKVDELLGQFRVFWKMTQDGTFDKLQNK